MNKLGSKPITDKMKIISLHKLLGNRVTKINDSTYLIAKRRWVFNDKEELTYVSN